MALSPSSADELSPRPMPKQGGWGENTAVAMEDPRLSIQNQDEIAEIPTIPVLEELAEEDLSFQVGFVIHGLVSVEMISLFQLCNFRCLGVIIIS